MPRIIHRAPPTRLERSALFVPGARPEMIAKAAASAADAVILDLEDSVAPGAKPAARAAVIHALQTLDFGQRLRCVRMNALDTPFAYRDIIEVVEAVGDKLDLFILPKAEAADDVHFVATLLDQIEQAIGLAQPIGIEVQIETAAGLLNAAEIAQASPRLEALIFGPGDYAASMHMPLASLGELDANDAAYPGHRWHAAMHTIVAAARAVGLRCLDGPFAGLKDAAGLERACTIARILGFDGKQCIHPAQLEHVNTAFSPSASEIAHAEAVLTAYAQATAEGHGAASFQGKMIDAASLRMARVVVARSEQVTGKGR